MVPGLALAFAALGIYNYAETAYNYPATHAAWHAGIASSVVFFLKAARPVRCGARCASACSPPHPRRRPAAQETSIYRRSPCAAESKSADGAIVMDAGDLALPPKLFLSTLSTHATSALRRLSSSLGMGRDSIRPAAAVVECELTAHRLTSDDGRPFYAPEDAV